MWRKRKRDSKLGLRTLSHLWGLAYPLVSRFQFKLTSTSTTSKGTFSLNLQTGLNIVCDMLTIITRQKYCPLFLHPFFREALIRSLHYQSFAFSRQESLTILSLKDAVPRHFLDHVDDPPPDLDGSRVLVIVELGRLDDQFSAIVDLVILYKYNVNPLAIVMSCLHWLYSYIYLSVVL